MNKYEYDILIRNLDVRENVDKRGVRSTTIDGFEIWFNEPDTLFLEGKIPLVPLMELHEMDPNNTLKIYPNRERKNVDPKKFAVDELYQNYENYLYRVYPNGLGRRLIAAKVELNKRDDDDKYLTKCEFGDVKGFLKFYEQYKRYIPKKDTYEEQYKLYMNSLVNSVIGEDPLKVLKAKKLDNYNYNEYMKEVMKKGNNNKMRLLLDEFDEACFPFFKYKLDLDSKEFLDDVTLDLEEHPNGFSMSISDGDKKIAWVDFAKPEHYTFSAEFKSRNGKTYTIHHNLFNMMFTESVDMYFTSPNGDFVKLPFDVTEGEFYPPRSMVKDSFDYGKPSTLQKYYNIYFRTLSEAIQKIKAVSIDKMEGKGFKKR